MRLPMCSSLYLTLEPFSMDIGKLNTWWPKSKISMHIPELQYTTPKAFISVPRFASQTRIAAPCCWNSEHRPWPQPLRGLRRLCQPLPCSPKQQHFQTCKGVVPHRDREKKWLRTNFVLHTSPSFVWWEAYDAMSYFASGLLGKRTVIVKVMVPSSCPKTDVEVQLKVVMRVPR